MAEQLGVDPEDVSITSVETDDKGAVIVTYQVETRSPHILSFSLTYIISYTFPHVPSFIHLTSPYSTLSYPTLPPPT